MEASKETSVSKGDESRKATVAVLKEGHEIPEEIPWTEGKPLGWLKREVARRFKIGKKVAFVLCDKHGREIKRVREGDTVKVEVVGKRIRRDRKMRASERKDSRMEKNDEDEFARKVRALKVFFKSLE